MKELTVWFYIEMIWAASTMSLFCSVLVYRAIRKRAPLVCVMSLVFGAVFFLFLGILADAGARAALL
jgi:uncharacterized membrane protein YhfC